MKKILILFVFGISTAGINAQNNLTPEKLWQIGRVSAMGLSNDKTAVIYSVGIPDIQSNKTVRKKYKIALTGGDATEITETGSLLVNDRISPNGKYIISSDEVKIKNITGADTYKDLPKSDVYIYTTLNYRHWDTWEDGKFSHVFVAPIVNGKAGDAKDIMANEAYDCPQKPYGGDEDFIWSPDSKKVLYVAKKSYGTAYAISTNTDLYEYNVETGVTKNLTESNKGYDLAPQYSINGTLAYLQMKRDGYEADKQDIIVDVNGVQKINLTASRDDIHVEGFKWSEDGKSIYFWAPINGTLQLFKVNNPGLSKMLPRIEQITNGDFDITGIVGQVNNTLVVTRTDMNHATELYTVNLNAAGSLTQLTHVNDAFYNSLPMCKTERRFINTTDQQKMLVWVIYPPGFDPAKKYPTLLYCQGGPQSPLTQFYSFRWNLQLMASQGYIVVAPNRRGMPGHGTKWNEQISKDHGGQVMNDYLSAIDAVSKEPFVDKSRLGCVGASYGGYSAFYLAGIHNNRFKTFIAHDGIFDTKSMYGTTEELWFVNFDYGGPYWDKKNTAAQKTYGVFNPSNLVDKWSAPILIVQGGKDYRVPIEQGLQAFQAAQLKGIKSKLLYLPEENHWVISAQNALVWQREFYSWLSETLK
ncbi:MAG: peptidase S9 prolyl oligopeptidase [Chitinophagaceae bacterium]|nr:MAG: peptidase S9 prolyl oligopeptidase [Chitinophagaceae bacterium]